jgi:CRP/FNR family transcriptional regulator, cyclic AMP receptor protein
MTTPINQAALFAALDVEAADALRASMLEIQARRGEIFFEQGEPGDRMFVIMQGKVTLSHRAEDGRETLLGVLGPGDMFGELSVFDSGIRTAGAVALTDARVLSLTRDQLRSWMMSRPEVAEKLLQALARRLRRTEDSMADLIFCDVPARVAKALLDLADKFGTMSGGELIVTHDMTQEELSQLVGASRETVNKALADFVSRSWIRVEQKSVSILDLERLQRRAR